MTLKYDFDLHWTQSPEESDTGAPRYTARFRDPATISAIQGADDAVRQVFEASGFELIAGRGDLHEGCFLKSDEAERSAVLARISRNIPKYPLKGADLNGFDFAAFLNCVVNGYGLAAEDLEIPEAEGTQKPLVLTPSPATDAPAPKRTARPTRRDLGLSEEEAPVGQAGRLIIPPSPEPKGFAMPAGLGALNGQAAVGVVATGLTLMVGAVFAGALGFGSSVADTGSVLGAGAPIQALQATMVEDAAPTGAPRAEITQ